MNDKAQILIVENEKKVDGYIQTELEHLGYDCNMEYEGIAALDRIVQNDYNLIILNVILPDIDGVAICKRIREISNVPIMMLSKKDDVDTKVGCLDLGADDYITKPFNSKELFARIRVLLRERDAQPATETVLYLQDITVYLNRHEVVVESTPILLTKKEFELLVYLVRNKDVVMTRERIVAEVWGYDYVGDTNIVDVYIRYIREKIGKERGRRCIRTVRGVGYVAKG